MNVLDQLDVDGFASRERRKAELHRSDVVGHFFDIGEWTSRRCAALESQEVGQRRLGALDLRRQHSLFANVEVGKESRRRQNGANAFESADGLVCTCGQLFVFWTQ